MSANIYIIDFSDTRFSNYEGFWLCFKKKRSKINKWIVVTLKRPFLVHLTPHFLWCILVRIQTMCSRRYRIHILIMASNHCRTRTLMASCSRFRKRTMASRHRTQRAPFVRCVHRQSCAIWWCPHIACTFFTATALLHIIPTIAPSPWQCNMVHDVAHRYWHCVPS